LLYKYTNIIGVKILRPALLCRKAALHEQKTRHSTRPLVSGRGGVEAVYADENVWLTQKLLAQLYDVDVRTVNYHLKKVFADSELEVDSVIRNFRITASNGKTVARMEVGTLIVYKSIGALVEGAVGRFRVGPLGQEPVSDSLENTDWANKVKEYSDSKFKEFMDAIK
jgi:hypothetical protein